MGEGKAAILTLLLARKRDRTTMIGQLRRRLAPRQLRETTPRRRTRRSVAHLGVSTFHYHFRSLTSMSPLQYQKQLRLHMARERMLNEGLDASPAAFEVGYESASQFNQEYRRFWQQPLRDVKPFAMRWLRAQTSARKGEFHRIRQDFDRIGLPESIRKSLYF
jgi:AraC-like DNA-binding protein